jgi:preprotein translocase subunit SecG
MALYTLFLGYQLSDGTSNFVSGTVTKKFEQMNVKSCAILERHCIVSSALVEARKSGAMVARTAVALSAAMGIGSIALAMAVSMKSKEKENLNQTDEFDPSSEFYHRRRIKREETKVLLQNYKDVNENQTHEWIHRPEEFYSGSFTQRLGKTDIESSINLEASQSSLEFWRQDAEYICVTDSGNCTTTCLSSEMLCGGYCTRTTIFENCIQLTTIQPVYPAAPSTSSPDDEADRDIAAFQVIDEKDCDKLEANCIASSSIAAAGRSGEIATGVSGVLSAGMVVIAAVVSLNNDNNNNNQQNNDNQQNNNQQTVNNQIPVNNLPIPVTGLDFPKDGCDDSSVRFADGNCHPVLTRGPCNETNRWVTIDPITLQV